jgi:hypothetical protein
LGPKVGENVRIGPRADGRVVALVARRHTVLVSADHDDEGSGPVVYLLERAVVGQPRWFCNGGGPATTFFDTPDEGVDWALSRASTVFVRSVGDHVYRADRGPLSSVVGRNERSWPPTPAQLRREIESDYAAEVKRKHDWRIAEAAYVVERDAWLAERAPFLVGVDPQRGCVVAIPGGDGRGGIHIDEFDSEARMCGARSHGWGPNAFGSLRDVVAKAAGLPADDPWVSAVVVALDRDRSLQLQRAFLEVERGDGELIHFSASANRESIRQWGLDWRRMGAAPGIAGSTRPELPVVFLDEPGLGGIFRTMGRTVTDMWAVDVTGLWIESGPDGWYVHGNPISPARLRLAEADLPPRSRS